MRVGFAGAPEFAVTVLRELHASSHEVARVLTLEARRSGRGQRLRKTPTHVSAEQLGIPVFTPRRLRDSTELVSDLDVLVVAAYGRILPVQLLCAPRYGCLNVHASLLPRWRGASPIEHAILSGDLETGISIMKIEEGLDTGPVYQSRSISLNGTETSESLTATLAQLGSESLLNVLSLLEAGTFDTPLAQDSGGTTYARQLVSADARIDWNRPAIEIERMIRAFSGRSAAFTTHEDYRVRFLSAEVCSLQSTPGQVVKRNRNVLIGSGAGTLRPLTVQLNRGRGVPMPIRDALNGYPQLFSERVKFD